MRLAVSLPGFPDSISLTGVVTHIREGTTEQARGVGLQITQDEYVAKLNEVMSSSEGRDLSLGSGPYSLLAALPRVRLATTPTPLHRAARLSKALGGPDIWFKRDDLTGFALGGNKVRKLEFIAAQALQEGADTLVIGAYTIASHRIRVAAAAAARLGLKAIAVVANRESTTKTRSCTELLGIEVRGLSNPAASIDETVALCAAELVAAGKKPFGLTKSGASWLGACGYMLASIELITQPTIASEVCAQLHIADTIPVDDIWINADYARGSGKSSPQGDSGPSERAMEAIGMVAKLEAIFLDPIFTGRAMAGLIDTIRSGELGKRHSVVFLHTGGSPP